jgi:serine/threonine protein kinase
LHLKCDLLVSKFAFKFNLHRYTTASSKNGGGGWSASSSSSSWSARGGSADRLHLRLADFGSGVDAFSLTNLYGTEGPTAGQQTPEYSPPEILFEASLGGGGDGGGGGAGNSEEGGGGGGGGGGGADRLMMTPQRFMAYDMWSVGVMALELLCLGTPKVFASVVGLYSC